MDTLPDEPKLQRKVSQLNRRVEFLEARLARYEEALGVWLEEQQQRRARIASRRKMPRLRPIC